MTELTWRQEQEMLEDAFVRQLLIKYNIKDVTTQRQAKNGTREFEFPVSSLAPNTRYGRVNPNQFPKLRMACFKSGYVRKQNGCYSPYQVNKTYNQNKRHTYLTKDGLVTTEYIGKARALIYSQLARLNYMLEYYLRNYKQNTIKAG
mgnify:CR=1 FL=1|jgi:hypothetical protein|tara:strand:+ start:100 stop:540 length:441 start_codon:yes stop_codon:yes gene_type:complete